MKYLKHRSLAVAARFGVPLRSDCRDLPAFLKNLSLSSRAPGPARILAMALLGVIYFYKSVLVPMQKPLVVVAIAAALCASGVVCLDAFSFWMALVSDHSCCHKSDRQPDGESKSSISCSERSMELSKHSTASPLVVAACPVTPATPVLARRFFASQDSGTYSPPDLLALHHILLI